MKPSLRIFFGRCAGIAAIVLAFEALDAHAGAPRDHKSESVQVYRMCRNFSADTRLELASLQYLLAEEEMWDLLSIRSESSCKKWIDEYWRDHDPIYTTPENEARVEHEHRIEMAMAQFGRGPWPGWDDRGEVVIRYGPPLGRESNPQDVGVEGHTNATEYWYYPNLGVAAKFEDVAGNGQYSYYLEHVELPMYERWSSDRLRMPAGQWGDMPDLDLDVMSLDVVLGVKGGYFGIPNPSDEFNYAEFERSVQRFPELLEERPVVYSFDYSEMRQPFDYEVAFFRGGEAIDRVDVNAEFEVKMAPLVLPVEKRKYRATAVVFDAKHVEVARLTHASSGAPSPGDEAPPSLVLQLPFTLAPESYELAITVEDLDSGRFSSFRQDIDPDDFDRRLTLSTVCFSSGIQPVTKESAFNRGALEVVPKPSGRYSVATSVPVYFEVYNLSPDSTGAHPYTVSYRIVPQTPAPKGLLKKLVGSSDPATSLTSSFHASASGSSDVVYVFLKTDHLWPGDFEFDVTVIDDVSHSETKRSGRFHLTAE